MGDSHELKKQVLSGLFWKFGERIIAQSVSFLISLILARLLAPEQYGTISLVLVFINIANVFVANGLGEALIQKKNASDLDFSSIFYCSVLLAAGLYILMFFTAKPIAIFYGNEDLVLLIRVLAIQLPISSIKTIQNAYVSKHMMFRKFFFSTLGGTIISGIVGIAMAMNGMGVWALVAQYLLNSIIDMLVLFITVPWRPQKLFDFDIAKDLIGYGWKLICAALVNTVYGEIRSLIIGKVYSESDLGLYSKGNQFPSLIISNINTSISNVLFPAMSNVNNDKNHLKTLTRKSMQASSFIIFPMMIGMFVIANRMILILLSEKWLPCVPYLQLSCIYWMFQPIQTANVQAIKAAGRSDICLKLEIIKKVVGFALLLISINYGVYAIVLSNTIFGFISMLINIHPNKKLIGYGYYEQFIDLIPAFFISSVMAIIVFLAGSIHLNNVIVIIAQIIIGIIVYVILARVFKVESYFYFKNILVVMIKKLRRR
jgi:O-antigen/teichoic acid export membrane protein